jgi:hypothetical protein
MQKNLMKHIVNAEYFVAAALVAAFYIVVIGFPWYWLIILFPILDISAVGYFINNKVGALLYNIAHSLIGPAILMSVYIFIDNQAILFISLIWLFHIFGDRALGFGLKHTTSFHHTHLGIIDKNKV